MLFREDVNYLVDIMDNLFRRSKPIFYQTQPSSVDDMTKIILICLSRSQCAFSYGSLKASLLFSSTVG